MYYKNPNTNDVYFYESSEFAQAGLEQISDAEAQQLTQLTVIATAEENKQTAISLLKDTDWAEFPSVNDPSITPQLLNFSAFTAYRSQIRMIAISPTPGNIAWPQKPTANWKL